MSGEICPSVPREQIWLVCQVQVLLGVAESGPRCSLKGKFEPLALIFVLLNKHLVVYVLTSQWHCVPRDCRSGSVRVGLDSKVYEGHLYS